MVLQAQDCCLVAVLEMTLSFSAAPVSASTRLLYPSDIGPKGEPELLEFAGPGERAREGGKTHVYKLALNAGRYLRIIVNQIDVAANLIGADSAKVDETILPHTLQVPKTIIVEPGQSGSHRLEVRSQKKDEAGLYEAQTLDLRAATAE